MTFTINFFYDIFFICFMKFFILFYKTPLNIAIGIGNIEIIKQLLSCPKIDINLPNVFIPEYLNKILYFILINYIQI